MIAAHLHTLGRNAPYVAVDLSPSRTDQLRGPHGGEHEQANGERSTGVTVVRLQLLEERGKLLRGQRGEVSLARLRCEGATKIGRHIACPAAGRDCVSTHGRHVLQRTASHLRRATRFDLPEYGEYGRRVERRDRERPEVGEQIPFHPPE